MSTATDISKPAGKTATTWIRSPSDRRVGTRTTSRTARNGGDAGELDATPGDEYAERGRRTIRTDAAMSANPLAPTRTARNGFPVSATVALPMPRGRRGGGPHAHALDQTVGEAGIIPEGKSVSTDVCGRLRVGDDGLITRFDEYADSGVSASLRT